MNYQCMWRELRENHFKLIHLRRKLDFEWIFTCKAQSLPSLRLKKLSEAYTCAKKWSRGGDVRASAESFYF